MVPKHECSMMYKFVEIEGKLKWNNELTLLKMSQIEKELWELKELITNFIASADKKYMKKETVVLVVTVVSIVFTVLWVSYAILKTIYPIIK